MSEFDDLQDDLDRAREATRAARREAARLKRQLAQLKRTQREQRRGRRSQTPETDAGEADRLAGQIAALEREIEQHRATLATTVQAEAGLSARFADFTDPRRNLQRLSDRTPILLMPLRIETRFKFTGAAARDGNEFWVRVYPDDVSIDAFEETLSESEVRKARTYWGEIWRAAGSEGDQRGAWRVFLSGQGAGRAYWVVQNYRPLNEADQPAKADGVPTVILAIVTNSPLAGTRAHAGEPVLGSAVARRRRRRGAACRVDDARGAAGGRNAHKRSGNNTSPAISPMLHPRDRRAPTRPLSSPIWCFPPTRRSGRAKRGGPRFPRQHVAGSAGAARLQCRATGA